MVPNVDPAAITWLDKLLPAVIQLSIFGGSITFTVVVGQYPAPPRFEQEANSRLGLAVLRSRARGGKCGRNGAHFQSRQCRKTCQRRGSGVGRRLLEGNHGPAHLLADCPLSIIARRTNSRTAGVPLSVFGRCCLSFGGRLDCIRVDDNHNNSEFCCLDRADLLLKQKKPI
jgi:hypothetical protein